MDYDLQYTESQGKSIYAEGCGHIGLFLQHT